MADDKLIIKEETSTANKSKKYKVSKSNNAMKQSKPHASLIQFALIKSNKSNSNKNSRQDKLIVEEMKHNEKYSISDQDFEQVD